MTLHDMHKQVQGRAQWPHTRTASHIAGPVTGAAALVNITATTL